ncbi:MAG TPA: secondary thiamine-phosphate synthase enzyme YjbQ [bacterium]|nr:secondary thiamine-phosphate synthase enzyme YjbQ [bacterium]
MSVVLKEFQVSTKGFTDVIDITDHVRRAVSEDNMQDGIVTVSVAGSTAAVSTIEFESGAVQDLRDAIERMAPSDIPYEHDLRWHDGNGFAHVRAAMIGSSLSVPLHSGGLVLGTWQQIVLLDFDNRPRSRRVFVQITGE